MRIASKYFLFGTFLVGAGGAVWMGLHGKANGSTASAAPQLVKTSVVKPQSIPLTVSANGYAMAVDTVEVRPQVQNVVREVLVHEGQEVRAGDLLFTLDERNDATNVTRSQAQVMRDQADLSEAENALKRNQELLDKNFVSRAVVDSARSKVDALQGNLKGNLAAMQSSHIQLGYNRIRASVSGRLGSISVHPGSLVQPTGAALVTIARLNPLAVSFSLPERELAHILASYPKGDANVVAQLPDNQEITGKLVFIDNTSDAQTGTIRMKAEFANEKRKLWPGMFVNVRMVARTLPQAIAIPAQAIMTGATEKSVYVVQPDNKVRMQKVDLIVVENGQAVVQGLKPGERIVVEGSQNLSPGTLVKEAGPA